MMDTNIDAVNTIESNQTLSDDFLIQTTPPDNDIKITIDKKENIIISNTKDKNFSDDEEKYLNYNNK